MKLRYIKALVILTVWHVSLAMDKASIRAQQPLSISDKKDSRGWTGLHWAAATGRVKEITLLLDKGQIDIEARSSNGSTPFCAAKNNKKETLLTLLNKNAKVDSIDDQRWTPLYWAIVYGYIDIIKILLDKGANIESKTLQQNTPLQSLLCYAYSSTIERAKKAREILKYLITKSACPVPTVKYMVKKILNYENHNYIHAAQTVATITNNSAVKSKLKILEANPTARMQYAKHFLKGYLDLKQEEVMQVSTSIPALTPDM